LDPLNIFGTSKVTNFQKLSVGMTEISRQSLHRGPGAVLIMGGAGRGERGLFHPQN